MGVEEYLNLDPNLDKNKIKIISPPFDTDEFKEELTKNNFRKKFKIENKKKIISFLGRIHYIKGVDFLIKGFAYFLRKNNYDNKYILCLIGSDDGYLQETLKLIKNLEIQDYVKVIGFLSGKEKNEALKDSDVVVQLSRLEQGAWAPIEAVLCETPIIVTSNTGSGEDVKKLNAGALVDFDDNEGFSNQLIEIFNNYDSWKIKTKKARDYIFKNLSFDTRIKEYIELYK